MNTIKSAYARLKTHTLLIFVWAMIALRVAYVDAPTAGLLYAGLLLFIFWSPKVVVSVILAACIALQCPAQSTNNSPDTQQGSNPNDPKIIGPCMCIVVLVVGAVVVYQLVKFCKAHLPPPAYNPPTNNVPTNNIPTNGIPTNMPAITIVTNASIPDSGQRTFTMNCRMSPDGELVLEQSPNGTGYWDGNTGPTSDQYFGSLPTTQANVTVDYTNGVLSITEPGEQTRMIILERSTDAVNWTPIATNVWSINFRQVSEVDADAPEMQAFYRVR